LNNSDDANCLGMLDRIVSPNVGSLFKSLVDENLGKYELALRAVHANFHYDTHRIFWMSYIPNSSNHYIDCLCIGVCCLNFRIYLFFVKASLSLYVAIVNNLSSLLCILFMALE
jgi:hypothetical protein